MAEKQYRYPGTRPFSAEDRELFFGRTNDIKKLIELIVLEKLVVLFSKSGYGKSSLLNAGVIPRLSEKEKYKVLNIRLNEQEFSPVEILLHHLRGKNGPDTFLTQKLNIADDLLDDHTAKLWFYAKNIQLAENGHKAIVLVFDQFEELSNFTDGQKQEFSRTTATLLNLDMPEAVRKLMKLKMKADSGYFTEQETDQLLEPLNLKIVFSLRNDRLSLLNQLKNYLPAVFKKTYELQPLDETQALDALLEPAAKEGDFASPPFSYSNAAMQLMLDSLKDSVNQRIETFQLQLICQHAEELIIQKQKKSPQTKKYELTDTEIGKPEDIFESHYKLIIAALPEHNQYAARVLIEDKLIVVGNRVPLPESVITHEHHIDATLLKVLVDKRLLRSQPNTVGGTSYEISHDTLVGPIQKAAKIRRQKEEEERAQAAAAERQKAEREKAEKEKAEQLKKLKQYSSITNLVAMAALVAFSLAIFGIVMWQSAEKQKIIADNKTGEISGLLNKFVPDSVNNVYTYALEHANHFMEVDAQPYENLDAYAEAIKFLSLAKYAIDRPADSSITKLDSQIDNLKQCEDLLTKAHELFSNSDFKEADSLYRKVLQLNPHSRTAKLMMEFCKTPSEHFMVRVEAGKYKMSDDFIVNHTRPFLISAYEITNAQYARFLNEYGSDSIRAGKYEGQFMINLSRGYGLVKCRIKKENGKYMVEQGYECFPVVYVSWYGANEYCRFYGGSLPTEAQWEYAAAGGHKLKGIEKEYKYAGNPEINKVAWSYGNSGQREHFVGTLKPNQLGLYDMSGNLWERCFDWYESYPNGEINDYKNDTKSMLRVYRGGSWYYYPHLCRVASRINYYPGDPHIDVGFRAVFVP